MSHPNLFAVYAPLIGWTLVGWAIAQLLPKTAAAYLGKFLFWVAVPISIMAFLRHAQLSASLWLAPVIAWVAMFAGVGLAWWLLRTTASRETLSRWLPHSPTWSRRTQGSFLLASMVGNTGYIGYPVTLTLVGAEHFAWALCYDIGSTLGAYGLGVVMAGYFGEVGSVRSVAWSAALQRIVQNPALWSFGIGILCRDLPLPALAETSLRGFAWVAVSLSLVLVGMRLSQLTSLKSVKPAIVSLSIKMLLIPLVLGWLLGAIGVSGAIHRVLLLQMAMPPAFATLVIAEAYELDQHLAVTALVMGCSGLLITLPLWLWLF